MENFIWLTLCNLYGQVYFCLVLYSKWRVLSIVGLFLTFFIWSPWSVDTTSFLFSEDHEPEADVLAIDLNESVQRLEAKCAGVREELVGMALSESYMRTKQAQLRAKRKEMEAKEAILRAELREKEAAVSTYLIIVRIW